MDETILEEKKEMNMLLISCLVMIIVILAFIALMIYAIGDKLSKK